MINLKEQVHIALNTMNDGETLEQRLEALLERIAVSCYDEGYDVGYLAGYNESWNDVAAPLEE